MDRPSLAPTGRIDGLILHPRINPQRLASELGVSYNTARARLEEIITALGDPGQPSNRAKGRERLAVREISPEEAAGLLGGR